ncbi:hypothetical protein ACPCTO_30795 [Streptomyces olivoreticuli]
MPGLDFTAVITSQGHATAEAGPLVRAFSHVWRRLVRDTSPE